MGFWVIFCSTISGVSNNLIILDNDSPLFINDSIICNFCFSNISLGVKKLKECMCFSTILTSWLYVKLSDNKTTSWDVCPVSNLSLNLFSWIILSFKILRSIFLNSFCSF